MLTGVTEPLIIQTWMHFHRRRITDICRMCIFIAVIGRPN